MASPASGGRRPGNRPLRKVEPAEQTEVIDARKGPFGVTAAGRGRDADMPDLAVFRDKSFAPELVLLPAGKFMMGSTEKEEDEYKSERPQHRVTIAQRFAIGQYPVTFAEYDQFCETKRRRKPEDEGWGRERRPVINVSWEDAQAYVGWLSQETGRAYRLPSEAEWEYACRAGTTTRYSFGDAITPKDANYDDSGLSQTSEVGTYPQIAGASTTCTAMSGSGSRMIGTKITAARRWTDRHGRMRKQTENPAPLRFARRLLGHRPGDCRSAYRNGIDTDSRVSNIGFRVARTLS